MRHTILLLLVAFAPSNAHAQDPCDALETGFLWNTSPNGTQFSNATTGTGIETSFFWTFGDGVTSNDPQPLHTYSAPGSYEVCLTVISIYLDVNGQAITCTEQLCQTVIIGVGNGCDPNFFAAFGFSTTGNVVSFQATSGGQANGYIWNFGDDTFGGGPVVAHVYAPGGPYTVCLTAWYWNGSDTCWSEPSCQVVGPFSTGNPCDALDAGFTSFAGGLGVNFQSSVVDPTWSFQWEFGDGTTGSGPSAGHVYPGPTVYQACLSVGTWNPITQDSCFVTNCQIIDLTGGGDPCDQLQACFQPSQLSTSAFFFNNCSFGPGPADLQFVWDFGDGSSTTEPVPIHTFPGPGNYDVCLTVFWQSCVDSTCITITVLGDTLCDPSFAATFTWTSKGTAVIFQAASSPPANGYLWDFGDGTTGDGFIITHLYEPPGPYQVCLDAWYWNGQDTCWTSTCQSVFPFTVGMGVEHNPDLELLVFPNPVQDNLMIDAIGLDLTQGTLHLFSADGRLVKEQLVQAWPHRMYVGDLAAGVHVLQFRSDDAVHNMRILIE